MKEEIAAGIKNAMQRGTSLEKAVQSFINAGYSPGEVQEAAQLISLGVSPMIYQSLESSDSKLPKKPQQPIKSEKSYLLSSPQPSKQQNNQSNFSDMEIPNPYKQYTTKSNKEKSSPGRGLVIVLVVILLLLIAGLIASIYFKDQLINLISNLKL